MLNVRILSAVSALCASTQAFSAIVLACTGYVEESVDSSKTRKPATVTIVINESEDVLKINGSWGCLLSFAQDHYSRLEHNKCEGFLTYKATPTEFKFHDGHTGKEMFATGMFDLDRVTGKFSGWGHVTANRSMGASWTTISTSTEMMCKPASRAF